MSNGKLLLAPLRLSCYIVAATSFFCIGGLLHRKTMINWILHHLYDIYNVFTEHSEFITKCTLKISIMSESQNL